MNIFEAKQHIGKRVLVRVDNGERLEGPFMLVGIDHKGRGEVERNEQTWGTRIIELADLIPTEGQP